MNRMIILLNTYLKIIKEKGPIAILGFVFGLMSISFLLIFDYEFSKSVVSMNDTYGEYAFRIDNVDNELIEKVFSVPGVTNAQKLYVEEFSKDNYYSNLYYMEENMLSYLGFEIISGVFPKNDQILICKEYLDNNANIRLGDSIVVQQNTYEISGVFSSYSPFILDDSGEYSFITSNDNSKKDIYNCIYFSINRWGSYRQILDTVNNLITEEIYPNIGMYFELQLDQPLSLYDQYKTFCSFFFSFVIFCFVIINYNYLKYLFRAHVNATSILNIIGVKTKENILAFSMSYAFLFSIGFFASAIILFLSVLWMTVSNPNIRILVFSNYMYNLLRNGMVVFIVATSVSFLKLAASTRDISPAELLKTSYFEIDHRITLERKEPVFKYKDKYVLLKLGLNNINIGFVHSIISIIGFALAITLFTTGMYYTNFFNNSHDNNRYSYKIKIYDFFDEYNKNRDTLKSLYQNRFSLPNNATIFPLFEYTVTAEYDLRLLSDVYKEYLSQDVQMELSMKNDDDNVIALPTIILGYSENEYNQLKISNSELKKAATDDSTYNALLVNSIYADNNNTKSIPISLPLKSETIIPISYYQNKRADLSIIGTVDDLPVYPEMNTYTPIIIVSESDFFEILGIDIPKKIYILTDDKNSFKKVNPIIVDLNNRGLIQEYINLDSQRSYSKNENTITESLLMSVYIMVILLFSILIWVNVILEYRYNYSGYSILKAIGFKIADIIKIYNYQILIIASLGVVLSLVFTYISTKYLLLVHEPIYGNFLYDFPLIKWALSVVVTIISVFITKYSIMQYIYNSLYKKS